jgi:hypothetical protein
VSLIPEAPDRVSVRPIVAVHVGIATIEVQVPGIGTRNRARPVVAVRTHIEERAGTVVAVAR